MDIRRWACGTAVAGGLLLASGTVCAAADGDLARPLIVSVFDRTEGNREEVIHAMRVVSAIYRRIDVEIEWVPCDDPKAADTRFRRLRAVIDTGAMVRGSKLSPKVMGFASRSREASSDIAFVLYDRVREHARRSGMEVAELLGNVIAHELGHLLLPFDSHTQNGIMRGHWGGADYELASRGLLLFDPAQGALIRRNVALIDGNSRAHVSDDAANR